MSITSLERSNGGAPVCSRRNVMLLTSSLDLGGAEIVIANLARHLDPSRFNVTICHLKNRGQIGEALEAEGHHIVGVRRSSRWPGRYFSSRNLLSIIRQRKIELVHSHTTYSLIDGAICRLVRPSLRLLHTFHFGNYPHIDQRYLLLERLFLRVADSLVAVGIEQRKLICRTYNLPEHRLKFVPNGVQLTTGPVDEEIEQKLSPGEQIVIGTICTLIDQKGVSYLLDVADAIVKSRPNVIFLIVGEGPLRATLEQKMRSLGLNRNVWFVGWKTDAATSVLPRFDIFFQPSLWEAMSMVVLEAMGRSKPMVVTDVGDNRHVVSSEAEGFLVAPRDVQGMTRALLRLIDSAELRVAMGEAAKQRYERYYQAQRMADAYSTIYDNLLDGRICAE